MATRREEGDLPGYTMPLNYRTHFTYFDNGIDYDKLELEGYGTHTNVLREIWMMRIINALTDEAEWEKKAFEDETVAEWHKKALELTSDLSPKMWEYIVKELRWKAGLLEDDWVFGIDVDTVIDLERETDRQRDYEPESDGTVRYLIDPRLYPLIYGRSCILPRGKTTRKAMADDEANLLRAVGEGARLPIPPEEDAHLEDEDWWYNLDGVPGLLSKNPDSAFAQEFPTPYSRKFQLLPCQVDWDRVGGGLEPRINSYINNLHPTRHRRLYRILEDVIFSVFPLWEQTLVPRHLVVKDRIPYLSVQYPTYKPSPPETEDEYFDPEQLVYDDKGSLEQPEPRDFEPPMETAEREFEEFNLQALFYGLQVIIKMTNVELTSEKPKYEGEEWHIEGQLNERICATIMCFYDSDNVTDAHVEIRQRAEISTIRHVSNPHDDFKSLQDVYGFPPETNPVGPTKVTQCLGKVLCRDKRSISYPNYIQNRMCPFELVDKSKPGNRKILTLHLVDPYYQIISTAHVPPQQKAWRREKKALIDHILGTRPPPELKGMVEREIGLGKPLTTDEARNYRLELIKERKAQAKVIQNATFEGGELELRDEFDDWGFNSP